MVHKPRIYQLLRKAGIIYTRNDALKLLNAGKVIVNGMPVRNPEFQVNPKKASIIVNNRQLNFNIEKKYFLLNKPIGYLTSKKPSDGKRHILELLNEPAEIKNSLFPVGRLDYNTSGLIILTNDGGFAHELTNPKSKIEKEYVVHVRGALSFAAVKKLESGVTITVDEHPYTTRPAKVRILKRLSLATELSMTVTEGKKRQIRLMLAALGHPVLSLQRVRIGSITLGSLKSGQYKEINEADIKENKTEK